MSRSHPLSFGQRRLWFQEQLAPGNLGYVDHTAYLLHGRLDVNALEAAFERVFDRHATLRTTFHIPPGTTTPIQIVHPTHRFSLAIVDAPLEPMYERRLTVQSRALALAAEGFDLAAGPLLRAMLIRWTADEHALIVMAHHIVVDGWSFSVILDDLCAFYDARVRGVDTRLEPLALQYADFVRQQREGLTAEAVERDLGFWKDYLAGAPALTNLPTDRPRPDRQTFNGHTVNVELADDTHQAVSAICTATRSTPYMVLASLVSVVLRAMTGDQDFVFGTPVAGRVRPDLERLVGLFLNLIAVRVRISPEKSLRDLVLATRSSVFAALSHQTVPFEQVVEGLRVDRRTDISPVFQVSMLVNNVPEATLRLTGLATESVLIELDGSRYDLTTTFIQRDGVLRLRVNYNTDLFDEATIRLLVERVETVARYGVAHLDDPVDALPVIGAREHATIAENENRTAEGHGTPATDVIELFRTQARATPHATALIEDNRTVSYTELDELSDGLAVALAERGISSNDVVGVVLPRDRRMVASLLALWKIGATFMPLDGTQPRTRLVAMTERARPRLLIADAATEDAARSLPAPVVDFDDLTVRGSDDVSRSISGEPSVAYLMFTSGSTGIPKGVAISRTALAAFCSAAIEVVDPRPGDICLSVTTYTFDISLLEYLVPLLRGAAVRLLPADATDMAGMGRALSAPLTLAGGTPTIWRSVLDAGLPLPHGLRLMLGGEATPEDLARRLRAAGVGFWSFYGPTEATVYTTVTRFHPPESVEEPGTAFRRDDLGRPFGRNIVRVLDADGAAVPIGATGTIYLGGPQLADGYVGQPDETARRFVRTSDAATILYDTGDLGRWGIDGRLFFGGRSDNQIKLHGFRVELDEIELHLRRHPGLRDAAVVHADLGSGTPELVAHLTAPMTGQPCAGPTADELRSWLAESLPGYMIPAVYTYKRELPRTANGKLDRAALLRSTDQPPVVAAGPAAAADSLTAVVRQLTADTLHLDGLRLDDDFFTVGGTSLRAVELALRMNDMLGLRLTPADVVAARTPRALASHAAERMASGEAAVRPLVAIRSRPEQHPPVVCLPSAKGNCWDVVGLLPSIPEEFPVFGLQSTALDPRDDPIRAFADQIEDSFAGIPCVLLGWDRDTAATAYELADELADRRLDVALTVVIGAGPTAEPRDRAAPSGRSTRRVAVATDSGSVDIERTAALLAKVLHDHLLARDGRKVHST